MGISFVLGSALPVGDVDSTLTKQQMVPVNLRVSFCPTALPILHSKTDLSKELLAQSIVTNTFLAPRNYFFQPFLMLLLLPGVLGSFCLLINLLGLVQN